MEIGELISDLESTDVVRRRAAAAVLAGAGATAAVMPLVLACGDPDEQVQEMANAALEALGPPPPDVAGLLAAQLANEGPASYWAATLLGRLKTDAAPWAPALARAVQQNPDMSVRQRVAWALGQIGPEATAAIPALESAAGDPDARLARLAKAALQKISGSP